MEPSNCKCECVKSCSVGEDLDYSNCKCRKKLVDLLIEECTKNIDIVTIDNENKGSFSIYCIHCAIFHNSYYMHWGWYLFRLLSLLLKKMWYS